MNHEKRFDGEMDRFEKLLVQSNLVQRKLEERNMSLKEIKMVSDEQICSADRRERQREREQDRQQRKEELENRDRIEMEKFKIFMNMMKEMRT